MSEYLEEIVYLGVLMTPGEELIYIIDSHREEETRDVCNALLELEKKGRIKKINKGFYAVDRPKKNYQRKRHED